MSSTTCSQQHRHRPTEQQREERRQQNRERRRITGSMNLTLVDPRGLLILEIGLRKGAHKNCLVQGTYSYSSVAISFK